jgi:hypothetical protein
MQPNTRRALAISIVDWTFIFVILANDFLAFLPGFLAFGIILYLFYSFGFGVSSLIFETMFGSNSFTNLNRPKRLFSIFLVTVCASVICGSPTELNLISVPGTYPALFLISFVGGGALFTYALAHEMLKQTNMQVLQGPIHGFWMRVERTGKNDDYRHFWMTVQGSPTNITSKLALGVWIYAPALSITFVALVLVLLLYETLYLSLVLDALLILWFIYTLVSKLRPAFVMRNIEADTGKALAETLPSYYRFGPKPMFVSLCLLSDLLAIIINAHPFVILFLFFPSSFMDAKLLGAVSVVLFLFAPLISYQLYFWWLLLRRSSLFLRVWLGQYEGVCRIRKLPLWSVVLFSVTWYPLIIQELLLGHHFYPYNGTLSLSFFFSVRLADAISIMIFIFLFIVYGLALVKLVRTRETNLTKGEILNDNILYGFISIAIWASAAVVWVVTQGDFPRLAILALYITFAFTYLPDVSRLIEQKFRQGSWKKRICYYGSIFVAVAFIIVLSRALSIIDTSFGLAALAALFAFLIFFLWFDARWAKLEAESIHTSTKVDLRFSSEFSIQPTCTTACLGI